MRRTKKYHGRSITLFSAQGRQHLARKFDNEMVDWHLVKGQEVLEEGGDGDFSPTVTVAFTDGKKTFGVTFIQIAGWWNVRYTMQYHLNDKKIEAYGVVGLHSKSFRRTFKSATDLEMWADKNDAEIQGTRNVE